jgi:hypothetical protein
MVCPSTVWYGVMWYGRVYYAIYCGVKLPTRRLPTKTNQWIIQSSGQVSIKFIFTSFTEIASGVVFTIITYTMSKCIVKLTARGMQIAFTFWKIQLM